MNALYNFEYSVLNFLQDIANPFFDAFFSTVTHFGDGGIFWIALAVILLCFKRTRKVGLTVGFALIFGLFVGNLTLKPLIGRIRPYANFTYIEYMRRTAETLLISPPSEFSFPSGHTLCSFESAVAIFLYNKKWGSAALVLATLVAVSRIYLYVHYLTDILAGAAIGTALAVAAYYLVKLIYKKLDRQKAKKANRDLRRKR